MGPEPNRASYVIAPPIIGYEASRVADGSQLLVLIVFIDRSLDHDSLSHIHSIDRSLGCYPSFPIVFMGG